MFAQSSVSRTPKGSIGVPSAEALGYCHSVRFADEEKYFGGKAKDNRVWLVKHIVALITLPFSAKVCSPQKY
jgi:hypothetical protein